MVTPKSAVEGRAGKGERQEDRASQTPEQNKAER